MKLVKDYIDSIHALQTYESELHKSNVELQNTIEALKYQNEKLREELEKVKQDNSQYAWQIRDLKLQIK